MVPPFEKPAITSLMSDAATVNASPTRAGEKPPASAAELPAAAPETLGMDELFTFVGPKGRGRT